MITQAMSLKERSAIILTVLSIGLFFTAMKYPPHDADDSRSISVWLKKSAPNLFVESNQRVIWTITPIQITGKTGMNTSVIIDETYRVSAEHDGAGFAYWFRDGSPPLALGTWRVKVETDGWNGWSASCQIEVTKSASKIVRFNFGLAGCY